MPASPPHDELARWSEQIRTAAASGQALRIRGGGSKDFYGEPPRGELLDTRALSGIVSYQPSELVVTVLAGTPLAELEQALAEKGQCLPFEPPHFGGQRLESESQPPHASGLATVGGMVAAGLAGPARASVGAVRDYVLGLALLDGRAQHLTFGGQVMKNVAGYDVSRLMVGAMGTLGVLTELSLKVLPQAPAEATLRFEMDQAQALHQVNLWGGQALPLNASCWLHDDGVDTLYVRLRGAQAAVAAACKTLGGQCLEAAQASRDWALLREQRLPWFAARTGHDWWRVSLPATTPALAAVPGEPPLIEWYGAQRWYCTPSGQAGPMRQAAREAGGHATLFIANDAHQARACDRFDAVLPAQMQIMRQLKREFDPMGIFNPGRLYPDW